MARRGLAKKSASERQLPVMETWSSLDSTTLESMHSRRRSYKLELDSSRLSNRLMGNANVSDMASSSLASRPSIHRKGHGPILPLLHDRSHTLDMEAIQEKTDTPRTVFFKIFSKYFDTALECILRRNKNGSIEAWNKVLDFIFEHLSEDYASICEAQQLLGEIYMEFKDIEKAYEHFAIQKTLADRNQLFEIKMLAYERLGICCQKKQLYKDAIIHFKKYLELAWDLDNPSAELDAYDYMGIQYYYMGDIERAEYYHDRAMRGKNEAPNSVIRALSKTSLAKRRGMKESSRQRKKRNQSQQAQQQQNSNFTLQMRDTSTSKRDKKQEKIAKLLEINHSLVREEDLPSPKGMSQGLNAAKKNTRILPHFENKPLINLENQLSARISSFNRMIKGLPYSAMPLQFKDIRKSNQQRDQKNIAAPLLKSYSPDTEEALLGDGDLLSLKKRKRKPVTDTNIGNVRSDTMGYGYDPNAPENQNSLSLMTLNMNKSARPKEFICYYHLSHNRGINNFSYAEQSSPLEIKRRFNRFKRRLYRKHFQGDSEYTDSHKDFYDRRTIKRNYSKPWNMKIETQLTNSKDSKLFSRSPSRTLGRKKTSITSSMG